MCHRVLIIGVLAAVFAGATGGCGCRQEEDSSDLAARERLLKRVDKTKALPAHERAKAIWELWVECSLDRTISSGVYEAVLAEELLKTGEAGKAILLEAIRRAPDPGYEVACDQIIRFGAGTIPEVISILQRGGAEGRSAALKALWAFSFCELSEDETAMIRDAVTPLLDSSRGIDRTTVELILKHLGSGSDGKDEDPRTPDGSE